MRKLILSLVIILAVVGGFGIWKALNFIFSSSGSGSESITFDVRPGDSLSTVSSGLVRQGLVSDALLFKAMVKLMGKSSSLRVGEYKLEPSMSPMEVMDVLASGKSIQYTLTFQEGINIYEIAELLSEKGLGDKGKFLSLCKDPVFIKQLMGSDLGSLEGYLFPETYLVTKFTGEKKLIELMVQNFKKNFEEIQAKVGPNAERFPGLSSHQMVTLASIIEKETGVPEERPLISSVFHNRLHKSMRLQSDPTIIYGIMDLNGGIRPQNISKKDILTKTRYNTYKVASLPHGPIANPGYKSILAAYMPESSEYLYFVSRNNGTHVFSKTYQEHNSAVKKFQLDQSMREGRSWRDLKKNKTKSM